MLQLLINCGFQVVHKSIAAILAATTSIAILALLDEVNK
jgi:hypothetical protein